jgi:hypothetical protein
MTDDSPMKKTQEGVGIVVEILRAAGDDPKVKEAASNLGTTAVTLTKAINNVLIPLAAINFAFDKAKTYFSERFPNDLAEKAAGIPAENIVEPKASIAGPALQGLAFTHEESELKDMYLSLLATAIDDRVAGNAHPAFVEIIRQLSGEEAELIKPALRAQSPIPIVQLRSKLVNGTSYNTVMRHLLDLHDSETQSPIQNNRLPAMIDNWVRLGLVEVLYDTYLTAEGRYSWAEQRPEFVELSEKLNSNERILEAKRGIISRTELGKQFAAAVGVFE